MLPNQHIPAAEDVRLHFSGIRQYAQIAADVGNRLVRTFDWRPQPFRIPRSICHRLVIPLSGIPKRLHASTIRLQVINLSGLSAFGFAWRILEKDAEVWYWDETRLDHLQGFRATDGMVNGVLPCPEMLFRKPLEDGLFLLVCGGGYEALALSSGLVRRTRWYAELPDEANWQTFVRDAGHAPDDSPRPEALSPLFMEKPARGWKIQSSLLKAVPLALWLGGIGLSLLGLLAAVLVTYDLKLQTRIASEKFHLEQLSRENAVALGLQKHITEKSRVLESLSAFQPKVLQLLLMRKFAEAGFFGDETKISLIEWEYRNGRLRLLFSVPKTDFSLGLFLSSLENIGILREVRLIPETPPQTVGIQALVNSDFVDRRGLPGGISPTPESNPSVGSQGTN